MSYLSIGFWNYSISSCVDRVMSNLLKTAQNTSKLGAFVNMGLYRKTGIDWVIEKLALIGMWIDQ